MSSLRSLAGEARARLKGRLRRGSGIERAIYYGVFSDAYRREQAVAARGHQAYMRKLTSGTLEYLLRRNIHMLEKGLTMRPRRVTFGAAYIEETVRLFRKMRAHDEPIVSTAVENWAREVLDRFFEATAESGDPAIARARVSYSAFQWESAGDPASGPHAPAIDAPPIGIAELQALAVRRKSVRWFRQEPVDRVIVDRAMSVAAEAPSACNRQPFTFRIFDDPEMVSSIAKVPMGTAGYGHNIPGLVVIVGDLSAFIDERDRHLIYTDGCLAAMSFILGLEAQGVASVCINWPDIAARDKKMSELLKLEQHERVVMLIGYGYADETGHTPYSAKRALKDLRSYNQL